MSAPPIEQTAARAPEAEAADGADRRAAQRHMDPALNVVIGGKLYSTANWSATGCSVVQFDQALQQGTLLPVVLSAGNLPGKFAAAVGRVQYQAPHQLGLHFVKISPRGRHWLERLSA